MNRPIKFRALDERNEVMHFDFQYISNGEEESDWIVFKSDKNTFDPITLNPYLRRQLKIMQFTGLLDKNGKEIYEGDILQARDKWADPKVLLTVVFQAGAYWSNGEKHAMPLWDIHPYAEVLGNIYENPELLNG